MICKITTTELLEVIDIPRQQLFSLGRNGFVRLPIRRVADKAFREYRRRGVDLGSPIRACLNAGPHRRVVHGRGVNDLGRPILNRVPWALMVTLQLPPKDISRKTVSVPSLSRAASGPSALSNVAGTSMSMFVSGFSPRLGESVMSYGIVARCHAHQVVVEEEGVRWVERCTRPIMAEGKNGRRFVEGSR